MNTEKSEQIIKELFSLYKKKTNLIKVNVGNFQREIEGEEILNNSKEKLYQMKIYEFYINKEREGGNENETWKEIFKLQKLLMEFRTGLTVVEIPNSSQICKKGMIKLPEYNEVSDVSFLEKQVTEFLKSNKDSYIDIYSIIKLNGHTIQISYFPLIDSWIIGYKNHNCLFKKASKSDDLNLEFFTEDKLIIELFTEVATLWSDVLDNLKNENRYLDFLEDIKGFTLIGKYIGSKKLIKHSKSSLIFNSLIENYSQEICCSVKEANKLFIKYELLMAPSEKVSARIKNFNDVTSCLNDLFGKVSSDFAADKEEGVIVHILGKIPNFEDKVLSVFKILNNEIKLFNKLIESLDGLQEMMPKDKKDSFTFQQNLNKFSNKYILELEPIMLLKLPNDKKFYFSVANLTFDYTIQEIKKNGKVQVNSFRDIITSAIKDVSKKSNQKHPMLESNIKEAYFKTNYLFMDDSADSLSLRVDSFNSEFNIAARRKNSNSKPFYISNQSSKFSPFQTNDSKSEIQIIDCGTRNSISKNNFVNLHPTIEQELLNKKKQLEEESLSLSKFNVNLVPKKKDSSSSKFSKAKKRNASEKEIFQIQMCKPKATTVTKDCESEVDKTDIRGPTYTPINITKVIPKKKESNNNSNYNMIMQNQIINISKQEQDQVNNNFIFVNDSKNNIEKVLDTLKNPASKKEASYSAKFSNNKINSLIKESPTTNLSPIKTKLRMDRRGYQIVKGGKKHKLTFADQIHRANLLEVVEVESFKKYNIGNTFDNINEGERKGSGSCCVIF